MKSAEKNVEKLHFFFRGYRLEILLRYFRDATITCTYSYSRAILFAVRFAIINHGCT